MIIPLIEFSHSLGTLQTLVQVSENRCKVPIADFDLAIL